MRPWPERSPEVANLLNPAFCGVLLYAAVVGHEAAETDPLGVPFEVIFLVLPIVLHPPTRDAIPAGGRTRLLTWVSGRPALLIGLAERAQAASQVTRESLLFMASRQCLVVDNGRVATGPTTPKITSRRIGNAGEVKLTVRAATKIGKMFAGAGDAKTLYATLGLRPL